MGIFKAYDIRGIYGKEITDNLAYKIGRALARYTGKENYMLGYDARTHSEELYRALSGGLSDEGKQVTGIGMVSTPQLHFFQIKDGFEGGVMVTASHNPPEYHGFKVFDSKGGSISYSKGLDKIEKMVLGIKDEPVLSGGSFAEESRIDEYIDFIISAAHGLKLNKKVVIDVGNGSSGKVFSRLLKKLDSESIIINEEPSGSFPNHSPNPLKAESQKAVSDKVRSAGADLGVVLDGDGDRVVFVDEQGEGIENFFVSALIAEEMLKKYPGAAVVYDLISSRALPEWISEKGGKPVVSKVGYTFLYDSMVANKAVFGSEASGHVYFKVNEKFYTESAAYALIILLKLLQDRDKPLSEMVAPLKKRYFQSPEVNIEIDDKEEALLSVEKRYSEAKISKLDGISVEFDDYWFNIRPSNTEPLIRLRLEALTEELALKKTEEVKNLLEERKYHAYSL